MQSKATTVKTYLAELPADRRTTIEAVRAVILKNLDSGFEEGMQYGMIGYYVPHRVYPAGYHCDPRQPLPFVCLASQKNYISLYMTCLYSDSESLRWFQSAWAKAGKKLNMGKCCLRFKKLEDISIDIIGQSIKRVTAKKHIAQCETMLKATSSRSKKPKHPPVKVVAVKTRTGAQKSRPRRAGK